MPNPNGSAVHEEAGLEGNDQRTTLLLHEQQFVQCLARSRFTGEHPDAVLARYVAGPRSITCSDRHSWWIVSHVLSNPISEFTRHTASELIFWHIADGCDEREWCIKEEMMDIKVLPFKVYMPQGAS